MTATTGGLWKEVSENVTMRDSYLMGVGVFWEALRQAARKIKQKVIELNFLGSF